MTMKATDLIWRRLVDILGPAWRFLAKPRRERFYTGCAIILTAALGTGLLTIALAAYDALCVSGTSLYCGVISAHPPWALLTAIAAAPSLVLTWYLRATHKMADIQNAATSNRNAAAQLDFAVANQVPSLFSEALRLLDSDSPLSRQGGVFALMRIAAERPQELATVIRTLAALVRQRSDVHALRRFPPDAQAAIEAIGDCVRANGIGMVRIDLSQSHLPKCNAFAAPLANADFTDSYLTEARLDRAILCNSTFLRTSLVGANMENAQLGTSSSQEPDRPIRELKPAIFLKSNLRDANLRGARLRDIEFCEVDLGHARLDGADLVGTVFVDCNLDDATFNSADLTKADLAGARHLSRQAISLAASTSGAKFPWDSE